MQDPEPTLHLLSVLLGKRAAKRVYRGSLAELFLDDTVPEDVKLRLRASRELVQRWLSEEMRQQPVLANPKSAREFIALHYAGLERDEAMAVVEEQDAEDLALLAGVMSSQVVADGVRVLQDRLLAEFLPHPALHELA